METHVSEATQSQILNALIFFARYQLAFDQIDLNFVRTESGYRRPPVVLTIEEIDQILSHLKDPWYRICRLLYGTGLRQSEGLRLRIKDIDFGQGTIAAHDGKGGKHRIVPLPRAMEEDLSTHIAELKTRHDAHLKLRRKAQFCTTARIAYIQKCPRFPRS